MILKEGDNYAVYYIPKRIISEIRELFGEFPEMIDERVIDLCFKGVTFDLISLERHKEIQEELGELLDYSLIAFSFLVKQHHNGVVVVPRKAEKVVNL
jgi:hypothetical protein